MRSQVKLTKLADCNAHITSENSSSKKANDRVKKLNIFDYVYRSFYYSLFTSQIFFWISCTYRVQKENSIIRKNFYLFFELFSHFAISCCAIKHQWCRQIELSSEDEIERGLFYGHCHNFLSSLPSLSYSHDKCISSILLMEFWIMKGMHLCRCD